MSPSALRRYRAERLLRKDFPALRAKVLGVVGSRLSAKGVTLDQADLESCYAQAFHGLYAAVIEGVEVENPTGWLVTVTFRRAIDESRAGARQRRGVEGRQVEGWVGAAGDDQWAAPHADIAAAIDDRVKLRQLFEGLRVSLSPRECEAASLCYLQGLTRAEAASRMGIREARMRKLMEGTPTRPGVAGKMGELLITIGAGQWCEQQSSLMRAYAFSILDPDGERHGLAVVHLRECSACRAYVASLRGLAAVFPPLPLPLALAGGSGAAAGISARSSTTSTVGGASSGAGTSPGWLGWMGSLSAKIAVIGVVAIGTGFALHGSRAHGSSGGPTHVVSGSPPVVGSSHTRFSLMTSLPETHHHRTIHPKHRSRRTGATRHGHPARKASARSVVAPEFSPERVPATPQASASTPPTGEFGF